MIWPQRAWLAGVIFWVSLAFAVACSAWWVLSNQETAMAIIKSGYAVSALLVVIAVIIAWMQWRAPAETESKPRVESQSNPTPQPTFDAASSGSISAKKFEMSGDIHQLFPGGFAKAETGGQIILDESRVVSRPRIEYPPPDGRYSSLTNPQLSEKLRQSANLLREASSRAR